MKEFVAVEGCRKAGPVLTSIARIKEFRDKRPLEFGLGFGLIVFSFSRKTRACRPSKIFTES
jgi:hypothetical protein